MTVNGLPVNVYDCPADGWVTLWSSRAGVAKDNPTQAEIPLDPNLGPLQELSMIQVNFTNVDCFQVNFANPNRNPNPNTHPHPHPHPIPNQVIFANLPDEYKIGDPQADPDL